MGMKDLRKLGKQIKEIKNIDVKQLQESIAGGTDIFEKFRTDLIQIQLNQLEFEGYLKANEQNIFNIMKELKIHNKFKKMEDYYNEEEARIDEE